MSLGLTPTFGSPGERDVSFWMDLGWRVAGCGRRAVRRGFAEDGADRFGTLKARTDEQSGKGEGDEAGLGGGETQRW
jgi:hypothetical protein